MYYRYKGTNGLNGLVTGNRYQIHYEQGEGEVLADVFLTENSIVVGVQSYASEPIDIPFMPYVSCRYYDMAEFKSNWEEAGECRCTHPGLDDGSTTCWAHHDCSSGDCTHGE
jgi:hypothetical protein